MQKRDIGKMIILTLVTFGIYGVYWQCSFQNQLNKKTGQGFTGFGHFFMLFITFGIYELYWQYAAGKRIESLGAEDKSILYLMLAFIGVGFVNIFLMQDDINKLEDGIKPEKVIEQTENQENND